MNALWVLLLSIAIFFPNIGKTEVFVLPVLPVCVCRGGGVTGAVPKYGGPHSPSSQSEEAKEPTKRASLVAQWLRICLPMQGTRVRALVWEDPTCRGATRPVSHNY